jgi:hypothetical protein
VIFKGRLKLATKPNITFNWIFQNTNNLELDLDFKMELSVPDYIAVENIGRAGGLAGYRT